MDKRGREYHHFPSKLFCRTVPKLSYGNPLAFHYFRISQTIRGKRGGGGITIFRRKCFVTVPKNYRETLLSFRMFRVLKNFVPKR